MRKTYLLLLLLSTIFVSSFAQNTNFDLLVNFQSVANARSTTTNDVRFSRLITLNDSMAINSTITQTRREIKTYTPDFGYEIAAGANLKINNKLGLHIGVGVNILNVVFDAEIGNILTESVISGDTISFSTPNFPLGNNLCDVSTNSPNDLPDPLQGVRYRTINLRIPLEIQLSLLHERLRLGLGGYLQLPFYTSRDREFISMEVEGRTGENVCTYRLNVEQDRDGSDINNIQYGASLSAEFDISNKFAVRLGLLQHLNNLFFREDQVASIDNLSFEPTRFALGLKYFFNDAITKDLRD